MKNCTVCSSYALNLHKEGIDQGNLCDRHYWQDRAEKSEKDAARYRWLKSVVSASSPSMDGEFSYAFNFGKGWKRGNGFDAAVDAAIAKDAP